MTTLQNVSLATDEMVLEAIIDVVGDDTSHEYCALQDYLIRENELGMVSRSYGISASDLTDLAEDVNSRLGDL